MKKGKYISLFAILGLFYLVIEVIFRAITGQQQTGHPYYSLVGWTSLWMMPIGGLCGLVLGRFNESNIFRTLPTIVQSLIGACSTLLIELVSGIIVNVWLKMDIWDYSHLPGNILGQITLIMGLCWVIICPLAFWLDDVLCFYLYEAPRPDSVFFYYKRFFTFK